MPGLTRPTYRLTASLFPPAAAAAAPPLPPLRPPRPAPDCAIPRRTCSLSLASQLDEAADGTRFVRPSCTRQNPVIRAGPVSTAAAVDECSRVPVRGVSDCFYMGRARLPFHVSRSVTHQTPLGSSRLRFWLLVGAYYTMTILLRAMAACVTLRLCLRTVSKTAAAARWRSTLGAPVAAMICAMSCRRLQVQFTHSPAVLGSVWGKAKALRCTVRNSGRAHANASTAS